MRPFAVRYCRARMHVPLPGATAVDVAQQVCLALLTALPRHRDVGRPFLAFVHRVAANVVSDAYRAAARRPAEADLVPDRAETAAGPEHRALLADELCGLGPALARLTPTAREVLLLRVVVGLSAEETARAVGSTPGAVRAMQHRALASLRAVIGARPLAA
ncbi:MAG: polymerase sigma factor, sigma-70 family [Pseudonocardia sp.]|nr:polymerase sigma factor, sigma-70 family [Pseudonocardia sp.]